MKKKNCAIFTQKPCFLSEKKIHILIPLFFSRLNYFSSRFDCHDLIKKKRKAKQ